MQEIIVEINSTVLTDHPVWTDGITNATGYAEICALTNLFHPGTWYDDDWLNDDILVSFKEVEFCIDVDLTKISTRSMQTQRPWILRKQE